VACALTRPNNPAYRTTGFVFAAVGAFGFAFKAISSRRPIATAPIGDAAVACAWATPAAAARDGLVAAAARAAQVHAHGLAGIVDARRARVLLASYLDFLGLPSTSATRAGCLPCRHASRARSRADAASREKEQAGFLVETGCSSTASDRCRIDAFERRGRCVAAPGSPDSSPVVPEQPSVDNSASPCA